MFRRRLARHTHAADICQTQVAARYGINVVPYKKIEKYFTSVDLRSAVQDNMAFKISFGTTFAMAAFMSF